MFSYVLPDMEDIFTRINTSIMAIDAGLSGSFGATKHKVLQLFQDLEKKTISAQKKKNSQLLDKFQNVSNLLYPEGTFQERLFSAIPFISIMGEEELLEKISNEI